MSPFDKFVQNLISSPEAKELSIKGKTKHIKAMARYTTKNYPDQEYFKIIFTDHSFLLIILGDNEIYYADSVLGKAAEIPDEGIGVKETLVYKGKTYQLGNREDYQFVKQLYIGSPLDIEGECRFSDYFPITGPKEYLSLGWLTRTGERADINPQIIDINEIKIE